MTTTPTPDDAKTAGLIAYECAFHSTDYANVSQELREHYEDMAQGTIDHWRRNVVVTESVRNEVVETIHSRISHIYGTHNLDYVDIADAAIKAALGVINAR